MPNFPGSLDSFTNPTGSTALAGAGQLLHSAEHTQTNDILLALETKLGQNPAAADSIGWVYTGDAVNKGIWVPSGAVLSPGLLLNSNFDVWQKTGGAAQSAPTTQNTTTSYNADRFFVLPGGAAISVARNTNTAPNNRSQYTLSLTGAVSVTTVDLGQRVRAHTVFSRGKQSLVFSCYLFNSSGGAFTPNLRIGTPAAVDNFATVTNQLNQALQSCANSAWTRLFHVFDPSAYTNINNGMEIVLRIPSGSLAAGGQVILLAQFDLRPGNHLMEYYPPSAYLEMLQCREYQQTYGSSNSGEPFASGHWYATTAAAVFAPLAFPMRAPPTLAISASGDFDVQNNAGVAVQVTSGPTLAGVGLTGMWLTIGTASGGVAGNGTELMAHSGSAARLSAIAEF
jgi:hypothetical protein